MRIKPSSPAVPAQAPGPVWDAALGVWQGERATSSLTQLPEPLWIFGYGSLCFKSDFPSSESFVGRVYGWSRFFAQRSMDHRGTPQAPGLVATMVRDSDLVALGLEGVGGGESSVCGMCYRVDEKDAAAVLENLDFREKGGYTREIVDVQPLADGAPVVQALLYTGTPDNPNFTATPIADLTLAAETIAAARGPSGANAEYLFDLERFLNSVDGEDAYISRLARLTREAIEKSR